MTETIRLSVRGVCVHFWREADRYRHQITVETPEGPKVWLASVEGAADEAWPPSPPLQELHLEDRPGGKQVALLVGRAGRAHWSLSVEADGPRETLSFDVACRSLCAADQLGSTYRFFGDCRFDGQRACLSCYELRMLDGEMHPHGAGSGLSIGPRHEAHDAGKVQTFRWHYEIGRERS